MNETNFKIGHQVVHHTQVVKVVGTGNDVVTAIDKAS